RCLLCFPTRRSSDLMIRRAVAVVLVTALPCAAQVGFTPPRSPYRDLEATQEATLYSGYYRARLDPAQVAPRSGPILGAHYQWRRSEEHTSELQSQSN